MYIVFEFCLKYLPGVKNKTKSQTKRHVFDLWFLSYLMRIKLLHMAVICDEHKWGWKTEIITHSYIHNRA